MNEKLFRRLNEQVELASVRKKANNITEADEKSLIFEGMSFDALFDDINSVNDSKEFFIEDYSGEKDFSAEYKDKISKLYESELSQSIKCNLEKLKALTENYKSGKTVSKTDIRNLQESLSIDLSEFSNLIEDVNNNIEYSGIRKYGSKYNTAENKHLLNISIK